MIGPKDEARFWSKVDKRGPDDCWEWQGTIGSNGYGRFGANGRYFVASRISLSLANNRQPIAAGLMACHICDNPPCVNPAHLFAGTHADNMRDCRIKGRFYRWGGEREGTSNPRAKLTDDEVRQLRSLKDHISQRKIAKIFGLDQTSVGDILRRESYANVK